MSAATVHPPPNACRPLRSDVTALLGEVRTARPGASERLDVLALDDALGGLAAVDARAARVGELRVFGGLTVDEMARERGVSKRTVDGDWAVGKMWLARALSGGTPP